MNKSESQAPVANDQSGDNSTYEVFVDPLQEAEAIKTQLRDVMARVSELISAIKRQRRQTNLVRSTLASLKQLQDVA